MSVTITDLSKTFVTLKRGRVAALRQVNLEVRSGEFFVLLGPSGCGKSTLLNLVAGIEKPTGGEIRIGDRLVVSVAKRLFRTPRERDVAMVFQSYALYPHLTVFENIAFPLRIARENKREVERRVRDAAQTLELTGMLSAKPAELSGGQRQRVALGRAIVRRPQLLLLDEPLSNLDALLRVSMRSELKQLQRQLRVTTLYVTHDQTEALSLGDRIAVMNDGRILQTATPEDIYYRPESAFVARFVGSPPMNLLDGTILDLAQKSPDFAVPAGHSGILLGVRPEHIRLVPPEAGIFLGRLSLSSLLGTERIMHMEVGDHRIIVKSSSDMDVAEGDTVGVSFDTDHVFVFDKSDGSRLLP